MTSVKMANELFQILNKQKYIDNASIAPNSEARGWLQELKSDGFVKFEKKENKYVLLKQIPEELFSK